MCGRQQRQYTCTAHPEVEAWQGALTHRQETSCLGSGSQEAESETEIQVPMATEAVILGDLECEVKWALESITTNKASGGDGIPVA